MATITKYKINGVETEPFRESPDITVSADFGTEPQASISIDSITLVDSAGALNSQKLLQLWNDLPTEGAPFSIEIANGLNSFDFDFYFDYTKMVFLSDVETQVGLIKERSLDQFDFRAQGITQTLLFQKGFLGLNDFQPIPYVVENRKTLLERLQILYQTFQVIKSIADEVHKILNIASDLPTLGVVTAGINLTTTIASLITLFQQLVNLFTEIQESFFPPVRYHAGIKPKVFLEKAIEYMGYDGVEFGTLTDLMDKLSWVGSKNNEIGFPQFFVFFCGLCVLFNVRSILFNLLT